MAHGTMRLHIIRYLPFSVLHGYVFDICRSILLYFNLTQLILIRCYRCHRVSTSGNACRQSSVWLRPSRNPHSESVPRNRYVTITSKLSTRVYLHWQNWIQGWNELISDSETRSWGENITRNKVRQILQIRVFCRGACTAALSWMRQW